MKTNLGFTAIALFLGAAIFTGCSKSNDSEINQNDNPITLKNIGTMHNQILDLYYQNMCLG